MDTNDYKSSTMTMKRKAYFGTKHVQMFNYDHANEVSCKEWKDRNNNHNFETFQGRILKCRLKSRTVVLTRQ